jgi:hypothetical protein
VQEGKLTASIPVISGVRQGCILSPVIFLMRVGEVIGKATEGKEEVLIGIYQNRRHGSCR